MNSSVSLSSQAHASDVFSRSFSLTSAPPAICDAAEVDDERPRNELAGLRLAFSTISRRNSAFDCRGCRRILRPQLDRHPIIALFRHAPKSIRGPRPPPPLIPETRAFGIRCGRGNGRQIEMKRRLRLRHQRRAKKQSQSGSETLHIHAAGTQRYYRHSCGFLCGYSSLSPPFYMAKRNAHAYFSNLC